MDIQRCTNRKENTWSDRRKDNEEGIEKMKISIEGYPSTNPEFSTPLITQFKNPPQPTTHINNKPVDTVSQDTPDKVHTCRHEAVGHVLYHSQKQNF